MPPPLPAPEDREARISGRWTFTATVAPGPASHRSQALCTWAIDAGAAGWRCSRRRARFADASAAHRITRQVEEARAQL
jgi:hypothetical protein